MIRFTEIGLPWKQVKWDFFAAAFTDLFCWDILTRCYVCFLFSNQWFNHLSVWEKKSWHINLLPNISNTQRKMGCKTQSVNLLQCCLRDTTVPPQRKISHCLLPFYKKCLLSLFPFVKWKLAIEILNRTSTDVCSLPVIIIMQLWLCPLLTFLCFFSQFDDGFMDEHNMVLDELQMDILEKHHHDNMQIMASMLARVRFYSRLF